MKKIFLTLILVLFVIPLGISQDLPSNIPANGLVAYYPFNGNANDESGNGNHGTVNGAILTSDRNGDDNTAYDFQVLDWDSGNNGGDYIYIPHSSEFNFESFTLSAWVYRKSVGASNSPQHLTIMRKFEEGYNNPNGESWNFDIAHGTDNGGSILIGRVIEQSPSPATKFECASTNTIIEKEWTNVIMTYSDKTIKTFINGVESCSSTNNNITLNTLGTSGISIGMSVQANGNWGPFDGSIDDVGIWNRALTDQEIQNLYTSSTSDIILNGVVSAENNQIKNVADPTEAQDAVTKSYTDTKFYTQSEVDALISNLQNQIAILKGDPIDNEGNIYTFKTFGTQTWTTEPAAMETYRDGTVIPQVDSTSDWANLTTGAWCYYENDSSKVKLYNWYAVVGIHDAASLTDVSLRKEFAPEGWHVPSKDELITLIDYFISSGYNYDSTTSFNKIAKAVASKTGWITSTVDGTPGNNSENNNSTGFNLHPHGYRTNTGGFGLSSQAGYFWTVDDAGGGNSVGMLLVYNSVSLGYANSPYAATYSKPFGLSVRLVKD